MMPLLIYSVELLPLLLVAGLIYYWRHQLDRQTRRDPLTTDLQLLPGQSLEQGLEEAKERVVNYLLIAVFTGMSVSTLLALNRLGKDIKPWGWIDLVEVAALVVIGLYLGWKIRPLMLASQHIRQGIRAERATAQEIGPALAGNNRVFHDLQAGDFNIDHVVVTPAGVFAVESKSRLKPPAGQGAAGARVAYDGKTLSFPGWQESRPLEQARRQAVWLRRHLAEATGKTFPVLAVLALPGWFIERKVKLTEDMVQVINPRNSSWLFLPDNKPPRLTPEEVQQAAFAIAKLSSPELLPASDD